MFNYKPLLKLLIDKGMTKTQLREQLGISMSTLAKISKNEYISMKVLDDICSLVNYPPSKASGISDFISLKKSNKKEEHKLCSSKITIIPLIFLFFDFLFVLLR